MTCNSWYHSVLMCITRRDNAVSYKVIRIALIAFITANIIPSTQELFDAESKSPHQHDSNCMEIRKENCFHVESKFNFHPTTKGVDRGS